MKKSKLIPLIAALLVAAFLLSSCSALNDILGFIQSLEEALPTASNGDGSNGSSSAEHPDAVETDEDGHVIKLSHYDGEGNLVFVHTQTWENDRIANKTSYDSKGNKTGSIDYEYDERGNCTVMAWFFWNSGALMKVERKYDEYDRLIEDTGWGTETVSTNKTYFEYDDKNGEHPKNYCKKTYYPNWVNQPGRYSVSTLEYDSDGWLTKITTVIQDGELIGYDIYTNENGKPMGYTSYDADGKVQYSYKYISDENGKRIREERYDSEGKLVGVDY
ncbi:MAG: hypothetical protein J6V10_02950 [Clostridia bacterium]|nr:hypothetical protein [Clostridia bacterium]